ncbi:MAG: GTP-binding protein, partial [Myxococcota bacterium]
MKKYASADIRNIALISHGQHGTTSLAESFLFVSGTTTRLGSVDSGNSVFDHEDEARERKSSVSAGVGYCEYKGCKFNLVDLPGLADFVGDVDGALRAVDAVVLVVSAVDGVEVRTERLWNQAGDLGLPRALFINKMDRDRADLEGVIADIKETLGVSPLALTMPIGSEGS